MKLPRFRKSRTVNSVNDSHLPEEVRNFTQAERRERAGLAWLVGIVSMVVLVLVLFILFFAGRWAYNKITDSGNDSDTNGTQITTTPPSDESDKNKTDDSKDHKKDSSTDKKKTDTSSDTPTQLPADSNQPAQTPVTGPSEPEGLPRTGPDLDL